MITPEFIGQIYRNTANGDVWQANSLTPGDWTKIAGTGGGGTNLDAAGDPTGVVTPDYVGQYYRDTTTGNIWKSTGATNADWVLTVQDSKLIWSPESLTLTKFVDFTLGYLTDASDFGGITNISILATELSGAVDLENISGLITLSFPNLITVLDNSYILILGMPDITTVSLPNLVNSIYDVVTIYDNHNLTTVDLSSFINTTYLNIRYNPKLVSLSLPVYIPTNGEIQYLNENGLDLASVDGFLARCVANPAYVSGTIWLDGGTNAAPTQGPGSAHDILVARGVTINHN